MAYTTSFTIELGNLSSLADHRLLVALRPDGLQLLGLSTDNTPVLLEGVQFEPEQEGTAPAMETWLQEKTSWVRQWKSVHFLHHTMQALVAPAALYGEDNGKELLDCQYGDLFKGTMLTDSHRGTDLFTLYRIPAREYLMLSSLHPITSHTHQLTALLQCLEPRTEQHTPCLFVVVEHQRIYLALFQEGWKLIQQYEYQTPDDVSYLILSVLEAFELDPATTLVSWSGWMDTESALYLDLYKYFGNLKVHEPDGQHSLSEKSLNGMPSHYFTPIIESALCVL